MYKHILIPTDGSDLSAKAVDAGLKLAGALGGTVTVMTVAQPFHALSLAVGQVEYTPEGYEQHVTEAADRILSDARAKAAATGVACETLQIRHEHPYKAIIETASSKSCDLIAMASHGRRGLSAAVLGSVTLKVLSQSSVPVLVYR